MYPTYGAHQITSVTELRQDTADIIDHAKRTGEAILVQRNNEPIAILVSVATYERYLAIIDAFLDAQRGAENESDVVQAMRDAYLDTLGDENRGPSE